MYPLLTIETYNDNAGTVVLTDFLNLHTDTEREEMFLFCRDRQISPTGSWERNLTLSATNRNLVPIVDAETGDPKLDEDKSPRTIGEYDMWIALIFESASISLRDAITGAINKKKGIDNTPLVFPEAQSNSK